MSNRVNQKGFIKDVVIIVLGILLLGGGYFYFSKKPAYAPAESSDWKNYTNDRYGFGLTLTDEYKGYTTEEKKQDNGSVIIYFNIDSSGTTWTTKDFSVFMIGVYPIDWWNKNANIKNDKEVFIKGQEEILPYFLGSYLGKNNKYAFVWSRGQDCPGIPGKSGEAISPSWQCGLFDDAQDVMKTFKFTK